MSDTQQILGLVTAGPDTTAHTDVLRDAEQQHGFDAARTHTALARLVETGEITYAAGPRTCYRRTQETS